MIRRTLSFPLPSIPTSQALREELRTLKAELLSTPSASESTVVFCHNDLLSGNVLYDEKAAGGPATRLIDFEYGFYNYRAFDLANHFCECCGFECDWDKFPARSAQERFFRSYLAALNGGRSESVSAAAVDAMYEEVNPWVLVPHLFWGIWAVVQAGFSVIDFDYVGYSELRLSGYRKFKPSLDALRKSVLARTNK